MIEKGRVQLAETEKYSGTARLFHWVTVAFVVVMIPVGFAMAYRGNTLNIWDDATNNLYSAHKLAGFTLLWIVLARLAYRLIRGAPSPEPSLETWQVTGSRIVHGLLYVCVIAMPLLGWLGVSYYPALDIFCLFSLPALASPDEAAAARVLWWHGMLAFVFLALIAMHVGMALFHHFVRKDNVLRRMLG